MTLDDLANLDPGTRADLEREVTSHASLVDAIRWATPAAVAGVVVQDEYTSDVVLRWREAYAVVYHST